MGWFIASRDRHVTAGTRARASAVGSEYTIKELASQLSIQNLYSTNYASLPRFSGLGENLWKTNDTVFSTRVEMNTISIRLLKGLKGSRDRSFSCSLNALNGKGLRKITCIYLSYGINKKLLWPVLWIRKYFFRIRIRNPELRIRIQEAN